MNDNWRSAVDVVLKVAPMIGTALGGPLVGGALAAIEQVFGREALPNATTEQRMGKVVDLIKNATPEQLLEVQKADQHYALEMAKLGFKDKESIATLAHQKEIAYINDTADARKYKDQGVFNLGLVILAIFACIMGASLYGSYQILIGGIIIKDVSTVAAVAGFVGTLVGYCASNAQQVVGYFYGSSAGSKDKTSEMADSFKSVFNRK